MVESPIIIDSISAGERLHKCNSLELEEFPFLFIGKQNDTIFIDHNYYRYPAPPFPPPNSWDKLGFTEVFGDSLQYYVEIFDSIEYEQQYKEFEKAYNSHPFEIFRINGEAMEFSLYNSPSLYFNVDTLSKINKFDTDSGFYVAYPIIITNLLTDTILIGSEPELFAIVEAKDSSENWRPIKKHYLLGLPSTDFYGLPPNYCIVSSTYKTIGTYKTKLRVKLGNNYSNEWVGNINYEQFEY